MVKKVLIIGGLSTTIALRKAGIAADLVEIKSELKVYHVGIIVRGNFIRAMVALGIADKAVAAGFPRSGVEFQTLHGHVVASIPGIPVAGPNYPTSAWRVRRYTRFFPKLRSKPERMCCLG